jgi:hypothetical protein
MLFAFFCKTAVAGDRTGGRQLVTGAAITSLKRTHPLQSLNAGLFIDTEHKRVLRRVQVKTHDKRAVMIFSLCTSCRKLPNPHLALNVDVAHSIAVSFTTPSIPHRIALSAKPSAAQSTPRGLKHA